MNITDSPLDFVQQMGWQYRMAGSQINCEECPICHNKEWKFYINAENGMWDCKHLNSHGGKNTKGSLFRLQKILGLTLDVSGADTTPHPLGYTEQQIITIGHADLMNNKVKLATLLDEWCITEAVARKWQLGYWEDNTGAWLTIPHLIKGTLYNVKFRSWFGLPKTFRRVTGASSVLLNEEALLGDVPPKSVALLEGEKDSILANLANEQFPLGVDAILGMTGGAGTLLERWYKLLEPVEEVYVAYDGDAAGKQGAQNVIKRLGANRVRLVQLPEGKDIADVYKESGPQEVQRLFKEAKQTETGTITLYSDILDEMMDKDDVPTIPTFSQNFNRILNGGLRGGQVIVITAPPKIGKTSFSLVLAQDIAARQGIPALVWCVEMPKEDLAAATACLQYGTGRSPNKADIFITRHARSEIPLYYGYDPNVSMDVLMATFRNAFKRQGIGLFVFDNIHFMVRNAENKVTAIEDAMKGFKTLALELGAPIILVAQPSGSGGKKGANMNYYDIGWSSSFASDADTIAILHRARLADTEASFSDTMMVKVDAGRYTPGGMTYLQFYSKQLQFRDFTRAEELSQISLRGKG